MSWRLKKIVFDGARPTKFQSSNDKAVIHQAII